MDEYNQYLMTKTRHLLVFYELRFIDFTFSIVYHLWESITFLSTYIRLEV